MSNSACPFDEGDRVDHKIFGFGVVNGAPTPVVGPDMKAVDGVRDAGWRVPVRWDDPKRTAREVMHYALRKVSVPDARPFAYWDRQWQSLRQDWLAARREVERAFLSFRPAPTQSEVANAQEAERRAFEGMLRFLDQEQAGDHP
jgi:hypothetical protein